MSLRELCDNFSGSEGLPFSDILSESRVKEVLNECGVSYRKRVFDPVVTLWTFLSQCLSQDGSCRDAVSRVASHRAATGEDDISLNCSAYCQARSRLPLEFIQKLSKRTAKSLEKQSEESWKWKGRSVLIVDGSGLSMQDTPDLQQEYPQSSAQKEGLGFPIMRIAAVFSLSTGCVLDVQCGKYKGKKQGESSLFRRMTKDLPRDSVMMGDKYYDSFLSVAYLFERGIDSVFRKRPSGGVKPIGDKPKKRHQSTGKEVVTDLGEGDKLFTWSKPQKPKWMRKSRYDNLPNRIWLREVTFEVTGSEFRAKKVTVLTTMTDNVKYPKKDIAELYSKRWQCELDFRNLKTTMGLEILRCKSVDMVHKELWAHVLAYNCLKVVAASAAKTHNLKPRQISFKGTLQTMSAFSPAFKSCQHGWKELYNAMLAAVAARTVGDRKPRWEPRAVKRRPKPQRWLTVPREIAKRPLMRKLWN